MSAYKLPEVVSIVAANPWISSERTAALVQQKHYASRLRQWSFWRKVFRLEYDIASYLRDAFEQVRLRRKNRHAADTQQPTPNEQVHYIERMLRGLQQFDGSVLFLMSGNSLISREFDELVATDRAWTKVCSGEGLERVEIPEADQTFSSLQARTQMLNAASNWVEQLKLP